MSIDDSGVLVTPRRGRPPGIKNMTPVQSMLATPVDIDDSILLPQDDSEKKPTNRDPEWTAYVLSHLTKEEKDEKNGYPKTAGLKRLVLSLIGEIVCSESYISESPNESNGFNANVTHTLRIEGYGGQSYSFTGVGSSNMRNTDGAYSKFPEAIASTRAYGRALRDALSLNCVVAEEVAEIAEQEPDDDDAATSAQKAGIKNTCKRYSIDLQKFINMGESNYQDLEDPSLTKVVAKKMMNQLNKYQGGVEIPMEIKV